MRLLVGALAAVVIAGCSSSHHDYPTNLETNFLNSCEATGGTVGRCDCTLKWLEDHVDLAEFQKVEAKVRADQLPTTVRKAISACAR